MKVEQITNRMYDEAKIRNAKKGRKIETHESEQKIIEEKVHTFRPNLSKSPFTARTAREKETNFTAREKETKKDFSTNDIDILKNKMKKTVQYNFQVKKISDFFYNFFFRMMRKMIMHLKLL
jgi:hypothetical protein